MRLFKIWIRDVFWFVPLGPGTTVTESKPHLESDAPPCRFITCMVLFLPCRRYDTRLYHRGLENNSTHLRPIIQINFGSKEAIERDYLQLKKNYGDTSLLAMPILREEL